MTLKTHWREKMARKETIPCPRCKMKEGCGPDRKFYDIPYRLVKKKIYMCPVCTGNKKEKCTSCGKVEPVKYLSFKSWRCRDCFDREENKPYQSEICFRCESPILFGCSCCGGRCDCDRLLNANKIFYGC